MVKVRCRNYDDAGAPINGGCQFLGRCDFIHPSEPDWDRAVRKGLPRNHSGGGRQNGGTQNLGAGTFGGPPSMKPTTVPRGARGWGGEAPSASTSAPAWSTASNTVPLGRRDTGSGRPAGGGGGNDSGWGDGPGWAGSSGWGPAATWGDPDSVSVGGGGGRGQNDRTSFVWESAPKSPTPVPTTWGGGWGTGGWDTANNGQDKDKGTGKDKAKDVQSPFGWTSGASNLDAAGRRPAASRPALPPINTSAPDAPPPRPGARSPSPKEAARENPTSMDKGKGKEKWRPVGAGGWGTNDPTGAAAASPVQRDNGHSTSQRGTESLVLQSPVVCISPNTNGIHADGDPASHTSSTTARTKISPFAALLDPGLNAEPPSPSTAGGELEETATSKAHRSWKQYIRTISKAVAYQRELAAAQERDAHIKQLQKSPQFVKAGARATERLDALRAEQRARIKGIEERHREMLDALAQFPMSMRPPERKDEDAEEAPPLEQLKEYEKVVGAWLESVRPYVQRLQDPRPEPDTGGEVDMDVDMDADEDRGGAATPSAKRKRAVSDNGEAERAGAEIGLTRRVQRVEGMAADLTQYFEEIQHTSANAMRDVVARLDRGGRRAFTRGYSVFSLEDGECSRAQSPAPGVGVTGSITVGMPAELEAKVSTLKADLGGVREQLGGLQKRDREWWREQFRLNADNEDLKLRLEKLEHNAEQHRNDLSSSQASMQILRAQLDRLVTYQPPAAPTLEEVVAEVLHAVRPAWQQGTLLGLKNLHDGAEQQLRKQQEVLIKQVMTAMQPTVSTVDCIKNLIDAQGGKMGVLPQDIMAGMQSVQAQAQAQAHV
ncbi:hypothetical protein WOLCODRAFT_135953 [Wolfiporia cocos MD-104 SS10]|uniref:C3H1-type domain-containing protein n=1 Tax=Wolfiporia cocos (strain MD-104) TaxID=742152 RepID=A0A2H3J6Q9_WOLCO|nr:hypothetical protein WOLCODRAFT_135953 [Wolfiporia cocos MD-104 SS10]